MQLNIDLSILSDISLRHAPCAKPQVLRTTAPAPCTTPYAPCTTPPAPCSPLHAPSPTLSAPRPLRQAPRSLLPAPCSLQLTLHQASQCGADHIDGIVDRQCCRIDDEIIIGWIGYIGIKVFADESLAIGFCFNNPAFGLIGC